MKSRYKLWDDTYGDIVCSRAEDAIIKGDVDSMSSIAFTYSEHESSHDSHAREMCQKELERLARVGKKQETQTMRTAAQRKLWDANKAKEAECKLKCGKTRNHCSICY